jgi:UDP-N-acetylglucosamine 2-epimerase (non-hydrolysing)
MKILPIWLALKSREDVRVVWVHTGQHSSRALAGQLFEEMFRATPDIDLDARGADIFATRSEIERRYTALLKAERPDLVFIPGDVISSIAVWYAASLHCVSVCHVEAGLRSGVASAEELHRRVIDVDCALYLTHSEQADANLHAEGRDTSRVVRTGNFMIDTLKHMKPRINASTILGQLRLRELGYVLVTMHHHENISNDDRLNVIVQNILDLRHQTEVVFPAHTNTFAALSRLGLAEKLLSAGVKLLEPLRYSDFLRLLQDCLYSVTDSDGVEEECAFLKKICFAVRRATARRITVECGSTKLITPDDVSKTYDQFVSLGDSRIIDIPLWDGSATGRLLEDLERRGLLAVGETHEFEQRRRMARRI